jgi:hypothetical protein
MELHDKKFTQDTMWAMPEGRIVNRLKLSREQLEALWATARVEDPIVRQVLARVPPSWQIIEPFDSGAAFRRGNIQTIITVQRYDDDRIWVHVSAAGRRGTNSWFLPDWEDLKRVKNDFIGPDRWAYQVLPPPQDYVNMHAQVLHLYALLDGGPALPDFTRGTGGI